MKKTITFIITLLCISVISINQGIVVHAAKNKVKSPQKIVVQQYKVGQIKIKWERVKKAKGYRIYRYNGKRKKYLPVKTIYKNSKTKWVDTNLKKNKIYKYKISSFIVKKGKKVFSKKSYWVSAKTYNATNTSVNVNQVDIVQNTPIKIGLCSKLKIETLIIPDSKSGNNNAKVFSKKLRWSSDNRKILRVNQKGQIKSFDKQGVCYVYVMAHNGKRKRIKVNIVNFANPKSFLYYKGNNEYINNLLVNYKKEVCNIATYFTKYQEQKGIIEIDDNGNIVGVPQSKHYSEIKSDVSTLLTKFPLVMKIYYSDQGVRFKMNYNASGSSYCDVVYYKGDDCSESPLKIAPHWTAKQKVI